jgi:hypothetical protein
VSVFSHSKPAITLFSSCRGHSSSTFLPCYLSSMFSCLWVGGFLPGAHLASGIISSCLRSALKTLFISTCRAAPHESEADQSSRRVTTCSLPSHLHRCSDMNLPQCLAADHSWGCLTSSEVWRWLRDLTLSSRDSGATIPRATQRKREQGAVDWESSHSESLSAACIR